MLIAVIFGWTEMQKYELRTKLRKYWQLTLLSLFGCCRKTEPYWI